MGLRRVSRVRRHRVWLRGPLRRAGCWAVLFGICLALAEPAAAQSSAEFRRQIDDLKNQIITLRAQIADLESVVYGGGAAPRSTGASATGGETSDRDKQRLAITETRLDEVDEWKRTVAGRFDEVANLVRRVEGRIDKLVADVDFRLSTLEDDAALATAEAQVDRSPATQAGTTPDRGPAIEAAGTPGATRARSATATVAGDPGSGYEPSGAPRDLGTIPAGSDGATESQVAALPARTPEEQYREAFQLLRVARYEEANVALSAFVDANPEHPLTENASYWRGESFYARKLFGDAARIYAMNLQRFPDGGKAPDNMVKLGMSLVNLERYEDACRAFDQLDQDYPNMTENIREAAQRARAAAGCL